ncbi:Cell differentiation protein rcd1 [Cryomyces minteri]|uniref:Cell differentiation protein rcd1 n=1 Tax=Cryomyces minteri TaxID=331657 RepID=A0A4U0WYC6_9PEZI|nr:Cell differentiation protein rcd1 [Cryomyces minteri]
MLPNHVFSHQHQYAQNNHTSSGLDWQHSQHQNQNHHQQHPHSQHAAQQHAQAQAQAQAQAAAAAAAAAQQQHYQRIAGNNRENSIPGGIRGGHPGGGGGGDYDLGVGLGQHQSLGSLGGNMSGQGLGSMGGGGGGQVPNGMSMAALGGQTLTGAQVDLEGNEENRRLLEWIAQLMNVNTREAALLELSKKREQVPQLALILWHSFGVMTSLLQEIISVYPLLNPSQLTAAASNPHIPLFLYPFLNTTSKSRPFEYLRLTSLGVIGALVKNDSSEVINFLLTTEIIPLCLRIMETGSELSKTVAIFIVQKILLDDVGLSYICHTYERFYAVGTVLSNMVNQLVEQQTVRLLKHVVRCFLRLSDNARAREALRQCLPEPLRDATFSSVLRDDAATKRCLAQLLLALSDQVVDPSGHQGLLP